MEDGYFLRFSGHDISVRQCPSQAAPHSPPTYKNRTYIHARSSPAALCPAHLFVASGKLDARESCSIRMEGGMAVRKVPRDTRAEIP